MRTAILIDGGYFVKAFRRIDPANHWNAERAAECAHQWALAHLIEGKGESKKRLIAGDADFVAAAKQARREGIDFILDPMWANVPASLQEHIDGLRTTCPRPARHRAVDGIQVQEVGETS